MGLKRLSIQDLTPEHLTLLNSAVKLFPNASVDDYIVQAHKGKLVIYEIQGRLANGLLGLRWHLECVWLEFACGDGLIAEMDEIWQEIHQVVGHRVTECLVSNPALARLFVRKGWKPVGTLMRVE